MHYHNFLTSFCFFWCAAFVAKLMYLDPASAEQTQRHRRTGEVSIEHIRTVPETTALRCGLSYVVVPI